MDQGQGPSGRRQAATYAPPPHLREKIEIVPMGATVEGPQSWVSQ